MMQATGDSRSQTGKHSDKFEFTVHFKQPHKPTEEERSWNKHNEELETKKGKLKKK